MPHLFERDGPGADYEELHLVQDRASGLRAVIAIHSTRRGPAAGGIRRLPYHDEAAAVTDALRLAEGMTLKNAVAELPAGGCKTVILDRPDLHRPAAYRRLGEAVRGLGGRYLAGPDVGTGDEELAIVRQEAPRWTNPPLNDAALSTARGVLAGIRAVLRMLHGDPSFEGRRFVVQGLGAVGRAVAGALREAGGEVAGADPSPHAQRAARGLGLDLVAVDEALTAPADVLVPCALGSILDEQVVPKLRARAVCGSANNQLVSDAVGNLLRQHDVLYAPDFVVNAGAVIEGVYTMLHHGGGDGTADAAADAEVRAAAREHIERTEDRLRAILERALQEDRDPQEVALEVARRNVMMAEPASRMAGSA